MILFNKTIRRILYCISAVLAGFALSFLFITSQINGKILNPDFHKQLFIKNHIAEHSYNMIQSSIKEFIAGYSKDKAENTGQSPDLLSILEKSVTREMVAKNVDILRDQLFSYFRGLRTFLPDIQLDGQEIPLNELAVQAAEKYNTNPTAKIEKINLSAILLYINRNDIIDDLAFLKLVYTLMSALPGFILPFLLLCLAIGLILCKKLLHMSRWLSFALATNGIISLTIGILLSIYIQMILPGSLSPIAMSVPIQTEILYLYLRDCILPLSVLLSVSGSLALIFAVLVFYTVRFFPAVYEKMQSDPMYPMSKTKKVLKYSAYLLVLSLILHTALLKYEEVSKTLESSSFQTLFSKFKKTNAVTQVISAKEENIYVLQVKLVDRKENKPVADITMNVNGWSGSHQQYFYETASTDNDGNVKYKLDKGSFRLSFIPAGFPQAYQLPNPFFFELKTSGITIITVYLDHNPEVDQRGVVEIEVMDHENKPVSNLQLSLQTLLPFPSDARLLYAYTNNEGIAVFKVGEGSYMTSFTNIKFPPIYQFPEPFKVAVVADRTSRYSYRLAETAAANAKEQNESVEKKKK